ncbi:MAG: VCBS repeat-containing protein [Phycisphaerales bacterium]|nr:VCBS repeat-containing protein [Phycisphaerales bacterium]
MPRPIPIITAPLVTLIAIAGSASPCLGQECVPGEMFPSAGAHLPPGSFLGQLGQGVDAADLDGDGDVDAVGSVPFLPGRAFNVFINNGTADPTITPVTEGADGAQYVELADLDGDTLVDLVLSLFGGGIEVRAGLGDGTFGPPTVYPLGTRTFDVAAVDMNGDGLPDLVATDDGTDTLGVFMGLGDGTFLPAVTYPTGALPLAFAAVDLDLDGWTDIAVPNWNGNNVSVFMNEGDGTLAPAVSIPVEQPGEVVAGDFNGDTIPDLFVSAGTEASAVLLGVGDGTFTNGPPLIVPSGAGAAIVLDLDGDEHVDIACYQNSTSYSVVYTYLGNGDATFAFAGSYHTMEAHTSIVAADWTGDEIDDLLIMYAGLRVAPGNGDGTLDTLPATPTGGAASIVVDMNGDGILDLVGSDPNGQYVRIALGLGEGTFALPVEATSPESIWHIAHGDLDGDGDVDLVGTNQNLTGRATVFLGNGDGTVSVGTSHATDGTPKTVALADVDEDGILDLLVAHGSVDAVTLGRGNGDGTFQPVTTISAGRHEVVVVDLDGDGHLDLAQPIDGGFARRLGNGDGTFRPVQSTVLPLLGLDSWGGSLTASDVDGDGVLDVLAVGAAAPDVIELAVCLGTGGGNFAVAMTFPTGQTVDGSRSLAVGDFDGDGVPDVATTVSPGGPQPISVLHGIGDGSFGAPTLFDGGALSHDIAAADLDADDAVDLAVANLNNRSITIMLNRCPGAPDCSADLDASGDVGFNDLLAVLSAWGACDSCPADLDGDGSVGFGDLLTVLSQWGPCGS